MLNRHYGKYTKIKNSNLYQQRYHAYNFSIRPLSIFPFSFIWLILSIIISIKLYIEYKKTAIYYYDYTNCNSTIYSNKSCLWLITNTNLTKCTCSINIYISSPLLLPVYFGYSIKGYYQNHLLYRNSFDPLQLSGRLHSTPSDSCGIWSYYKQITILPCGIIAATFFNDTFKFITYNSSSFSYEFKYIELDYIDKIRFRNPNIPEGKTLQDIFDEFISPPQWSRNLSQLDPYNPEYNALINPDFVNWMHPAPFPNLVKPYRIITHFNETYLNIGNYTIIIDYKFPLYDPSVKKAFIILTTYQSGTKNFPLFILSIISTTICLIFSICGFIQFFKRYKPKLLY